MQRFEKLKTHLLLLGFIELVILIITQIFLKQALAIIQYVLILLNLLIVFILFTTSRKSYQDRVLTVTHVLGKESGEAFAYAKMGILTYDENFIITWMSEVFDDYKINRIGESIFDVFPKIRPVINDMKETIYLEVDEHIFEVSHLSSKGVIVFQEKTEIGKLKQDLNDNAVVLGFAYLDNYEETTAYEDEQTIANIDTNIRDAVVNWADENTLMLRRLRPDRYLLVLNEKTFSQIEEENFKILNTIRNESAKIDANITLSMSFARNSQNYKELEEMAHKALELAQSRGGDQIAINTKGESMRYQGGTVEAIEKRSKVRVRVTAQDINQIMKDSKQVLIVGHQMMDFDCMGSALGVAAIANANGIKNAIVLNPSDVEQKLSETIENNMEEFRRQYTFVTPSEAIDMVKKDTLLVMVDHHNIEQTQVPALIESAKKIIVIDHHRRTGAFTFEPELAYIEPSASSASELVIEMFPYQRNKVNMTSFVSSIMYAGILIDTNRFRNRTGSRTFEALAELRKFGANLSQVENFLREEYEDFELKIKVLNQSELHDDGYVIAAYKDGYLRRALMSQVADEILKVRNVEGSFVVSNINEDTVAISARSKGDLNVQRVMEELGGGGHFTGAATQMKGRNINEVVELLKTAIETVRKEVN